MHEYDVTLKLLLQNLAATATRELTGVTIVRWHNVELPEIRNTRVDLLGDTADGELIHIELQSANDNTMALRMLEYALGVYRIYQQFPRHIVLYAGLAALQMQPSLAAERLSFSYEQVDMRDLDGERLLGSDRVSDNLIAILTRLRDHKVAVRRILERITELAPAERGIAFKQLSVLAGLRDLEQFVAEEARKMPILTDINDHKVIGPALRQGRQEEAVAILRRQMEKRFGPLPAWVLERLTTHSTMELEEIAVALLDAPSLEALLPS